MGLHIERLPGESITLDKANGEQYLLICNEKTISFYSSMNEESELLFRWEAPISIGKQVFLDDDIEVRLTSPKRLDHGINFLIIAPQWVTISRSEKHRTMADRLVEVYG